MSIVGDIETVGSAAGGNPFAWARIAFKVLPYVAIAGLTIALQISRAELDHIRMQGKLETKDVEISGARHEAEQASRFSTAILGFATALRDREPVIVRATDTVREYANTPAGRAVCAAPDVVRRTDALDEALFPPVPAGGGAGAGEGGLPADAPPPPAGWLGHLFGR